MYRRLSLLPRLSLLLRTSPSRQPTIPSSRMSSPRKHPLNSSYEKKWRLRLRQHSGVRWLLCSHLLDPTGYHAVAVGCESAPIATFHLSRTSCGRIISRQYLNLKVRRLEGVTSSWENSGGTRALPGDGTTDELDIEGQCMYICFIISVFS